MMMAHNPLKWFQKKAVNVDIAPTPLAYNDTIKLPSVVLIHGAHQSSTTFEYFRHALPGFQYINIDWNAAVGFYENLQEMVTAIENQGPVYIIGHSMGGIYAAHLSQHVTCVGGATIATPWGGSRHADIARYMFPGYPIYRDVGTRSSAILDAQIFELPGYWTNYVSTAGNVPGFGSPNDCVLTIESMTTRSDIHTNYISATHYEIVMSSDLIRSIANNFLRACEKIIIST